MGWTRNFDYAAPAEFFREHAALSGVAGRLGSDFDISGLAHIDDAAYDALAPAHWPVSKGRRGGRIFGDGRFQTADGRARMVAVRAALAPSTPDGFVLNTGRIRDQWHTMTRTGLSPRLSQHLAEPFAELYPEDAFRLGIGPDDLAVLSNARGRAAVRALVTDRVRPGSVFAPIHWSDAFALAGRMNALVAPVIDPLSGQPASKGARVAVERFGAAWFGFAVSTNRPGPDCAYWALSRSRAGWRAELAGKRPPADPEGWARALFGLPDALAFTVRDAARGTARVAFVQDGRCRAALFVAPRPEALARSWIADAPGAFGAEVLAGRPCDDRPDPGPTVCACFDVGSRAIRDAILERRLTTLAAIGAALSAGTNCGSCRPELAALLAETAVREAAE